MLEVIKGSSPANKIIVDGDVKIGISSSKKVVNKKPVSDEQTEKPEEERDGDLITMTREELESIRAQYRVDGERYAEEMRLKTEMEFAHAKVQADKIVEDAENKAHEILASAGEKVKLATEEGRKQGYDAAYKEGYEKGTEDGFAQGVNQCRGALRDLQNLCKNIEKEKNELMTENRRAIFDLSMGIAQKITMTVLNQKDKSVLQRMITNAAKEFRKAKRVKVTVSKLDLSDDVETDLKTFEKCFSETTEVEFEVLEDGEKGMLQIETDTEILDAGVSTQLKMIEELGSGKYRDKESPKSTEDDEEKIETKSEAKNEIKNETKNEAKSAAKNEIKSEVKSETKKKTNNAKSLITEEEDAE